MSGNWANVEKYGDWFTYDKTPRALIFGRDWSKVADVNSLTKLMRYSKIAPRTRKAFKHENSVLYSFKVQ